MCVHVCEYYCNLQVNSELNLNFVFDFDFVVNNILIFFYFFYTDQYFDCEEIFEHLIMKQNCIAIG